MKQMKIHNGILYFGPAPEMPELLELQSLKVDCIWNLGRELEYLAELEAQICKCDVICANIRDYSVPSGEENIKEFTSQTIDIMNRLVEKNQSVFVHCYGGRGRTGTAIGCLLVALGWAPDAALQQAHILCGGPEMELQKEFVRKFASRNL